MTEEKKNEIAVKSDGSKLDELLRIAGGLAKSDLVPAHFRGKATNCFIALQIAERMGIDAFAVLQNLYVVHGTPAFSAKFLIAQANKSGTFETPIMFEWKGEGDELEATAWAKHKASGERVEFTFSMADAIAEKYTKNPKYKSMPKLMLAYRAATLLCRLYCPETAMGQTVEEIEDVQVAKQTQGEASAPAYEVDDDLIPESTTGEESKEKPPQESEEFPDMPEPVITEPITDQPEKKRKPNDTLL